jgi:HSP20 family protein
MKPANLPTNSPTARLGTIRDDFDRIIERILYPSALTMRTPGDSWLPSVDFAETDKNYIVRLEAPGVAKDQIEIQLEGDTLTLRGERKRATEGKDERFVWQEREEGSFMRSLRMPTPVDASGVTAIMTDGVLTVTLPKATPGTSARIPVK